ncbi:hypothetical protein LTR10_013950 [Elasticomyces elasticus]|nr:hypothetical protein LTR10_013950 [Elasticomyces elasticus]KAK4974469.1 hypothetical protein LTR42_005113 [Elasticomyces elasticus]
MATARSGIQQRLANAMLTESNLLNNASEDHLAYALFHETATAHADNNMKLKHHAYGGYQRGSIRSDHM